MKIKSIPLLYGSYHVFRAYSLELKFLIQKWIIFLQIFIFKIILFYIAIPGPSGPPAPPTTSPHPQRG